MRVLAGTPVLRLYPGCIQVGIDPGHEVVFSGLSPDQEQWLYRCADVSGELPLSGTPDFQRIEIPQDCIEIAQALVDEGLAYHFDGQGLAVRVSRLEEPVLIALEGACGSGDLAQCTVVDPRPTGKIAFTYTRVGNASPTMGRWAESYFESLFPELPRPVDSDYDVEIRSIPLNQTFCEDPDMLALDYPRLVVRVGQVSSTIGPLLTRISPLCPLCLAMWVADSRHGVSPQSWETHTYSPQLNPRMKFSAAQVIGDFIHDYSEALRRGTGEQTRLEWCDRVVTVDAAGRQTVSTLTAHPECHCQRRHLGVFHELSDLEITQDAQDVSPVGL